MQREERQIQADKILDIESVSSQQTSALEVTISESDLENTEKLEALQKNCPVPTKANTI